MAIYFFITIDFRSVDIPLNTSDIITTKPKKNVEITEEPKWKRRGKFVPKRHNFNPSKEVHSVIFSTYFHLVR